MIYDESIKRGEQFRFRFLSFRRRCVSSSSCYIYYYYRSYILDWMSRDLCAAETVQKELISHVVQMILWVCSIGLHTHTHLCVSLIVCFLFFR